MHGGTERPEVVVVGGGPAGAVAATRLAQAGREVIVLERARFPRYHIGESLLSATLPILDRIGVTPRLEQHGFLRKPGGTFLWGRQAEPWSFWFREDPGGRPYAFQVIRAEFDQILLENARAHGADVREEHAVTAIDTSGPSPAIEATRADGRPVRFAPRFVIDASGQQALLGRARGLRRFNEFFKNLAIFGYFRDAERLPGALANHILSAAFGDGWFWYIPLHDGTMSVGAVVDVRHWERTAAADAEGTYRGLIARATDAVLAGRPEEEVLPEYERSYRGAFERYLRFLYFFYDHNADPDSYFWTARQILHHTPADREAIPALVEREQERWAAATRSGRAAALPGAELLRVRATERLLDEG